MGMNKYDRMLHILNLLRTRRNLNAQKLADECGVTERSIYRDIISLSEMNVPIYYDKGYKLASDNFLPPLNFTFEEYQLLKLALKSSPLIRTSTYENIFRSVKAKIESCLSEQVRHEKKLTPETTHIENPLPGEREKGERFYDTIESAISTCNRIRVDYESITSGPTRRDVDPYFIIFRGRAFYFVGYCHLRQEYRTFRVDRVTNIEILPQTFLRDSNIRPETYFEGSWSVFSGEPVDIEIIFTGTAARVVSTSNHHPDEKIEVLGNGAVRYSVTTRGVEEIRRWILGFGQEAEVVAPLGLRDDLTRISRKLTERYEK
ncbi:MAG: YafY family transcriptional regulator [Candidatus Zixiibacteriota bacterium]|nr:MAG: YafY family transcriptional regulator [candidate division Zixibacteria bacterium]